MSFDYHTVAGDYQYRALHSGPRMQRFWHAGKLALIDRLVRPYISRGARLVEIGCGSGNLLVRATVAGSYPVAVDLAMPSLAFVHSRLQAATSGPEPPDGFACIQAVGDALPFENGSFDAVLLSEVIEHLTPPGPTVREAVRVLAPGGRLLVTTPNYRSLWPLLERTVDLLKMAPAMAGEQHVTRFTPSSLRRLLLESDLELEHFGTIYGLSPFLSLLSAQWARNRLARELASRSPSGMILAALAVKKVDPPRLIEAP